jgi:hypothetical protein
MFSCGAGGTVLDFVAAMESCSLLEAERRMHNLVQLGMGDASFLRVITVTRPTAGLSSVRQP